MNRNFSMRPNINLVVSEPYITLDEFCRRSFSELENGGVEVRWFNKGSLNRGIFGIDTVKKSRMDDF